METRAKFRTVVGQLETLFHFNYNAVCRQLERDYEVFDPSSPAFGDHKPDDPSEYLCMHHIDANEDRFIDNLAFLLDKANYKPLTKDTMKFCNAASYLFNLPATTAWDRLDNSLVLRFLRRRWTRKQLSLGDVDGDPSHAVLASQPTGLRRRTASPDDDKKTISKVTGRAVNAVTGVGRGVGRGVFGVTKGVIKGSKAVVGGALSALPGSSTKKRRRESASEDFAGQSDLTEARDEITDPADLLGLDDFDEFSDRILIWTRGVGCSTTTEPLLAEKFDEAFTDGLVQLSNLPQLLMIRFWDWYNPEKAKELKAVRQKELEKSQAFHAAAAQRALANVQREAAKAAIAEKRAAAEAAKAAAAAVSTPEKGKTTGQEAATASKEEIEKAAREAEEAAREAKKAEEQEFQVPLQMAPVPLTRSSRTVSRMTLADQWEYLKNTDASLQDKLTAFLGPTSIQEPTFRELVVLYRPVVEPGTPMEESRPIVIKTFRDIPMADIDLVMPERDMELRPMDFVVWAATALFGLIALVSGLGVGDEVEGEEEGTSRLTWAAYLSLAAYAAKSWYYYADAKDRSQSIVVDTLYQKSADSNQGVIAYLTRNSEGEEIKETVLGWYFLWRRGALTANELQEVVNTFMKKHFAERVNFDVEDALGKLQSIGLAREEVASKTWVALDSEEAIPVLDRYLAESLNQLHFEVETEDGE